MAGTLCGPRQRRDLHFHAAAALRAKARRLHRQALLATVVGVRRRAVTIVAVSTAAVSAAAGAVTIGAVSAAAAAVTAKLL
nr:hypothetical protein [Arthrobacter sp. 31Y]